MNIPSESECIERNYAEMIQATKIIFRLIKTPYFIKQKYEFEPLWIGTFLYNYLQFILTFYDYFVIKMLGNKNKCDLQILNYISRQLKKKYLGRGQFIKF